MLADISYPYAFVQGMVAFLTPCILPMVPFYLSYMAGISMSELNDEGGIAPGAQRRLVISAVMFALGVTTIFGLLGLGVTAIGSAFAQWRQQLSYGAAALIFVFGLHFLHIIRIPFLMREARMQSRTDPSTVVGAYVMGLAFGFGWTACVGPVLASILMVAAFKETLVQGGTLLVTFGLGMTLPFVIAAVFAQPFLKFMARHRKYMPYVEKVMGLMLIVFAVLIATGSVNTLSNWLIETFPMFRTLG